jgi:4-coumarate--CoA ligase
MYIQINYPIIVNGIIAAGCIFSGTNPGYTAYELTHAVKTAKVAAFIVEPELLTHVLTAAQNTNMPNSRILIFDNGLPGQSVPSGFNSWRTLLDHGEADWERFDDLHTAKNTEVARLFSSGTTGLPKAAVFSHYNFIAQHSMIEDFFPSQYKPIRLVPLPIFHVAVAPRMHFSPLKSGVKTYLMRRFDLEQFLANIERFQVTDMILVPPLVISIIMSPLRHKYDLGSVKQANCGAAPLGKESQARLRELLREGVPFTQVIHIPPALLWVHLTIYVGLGHDRNDLHRNNVPISRARYHWKCRSRFARA